MIKTVETWESYNACEPGMAPAPPVDFAQKMLLIFRYAFCSDCGNDVNFLDITHYDNTVAVTVNSFFPGEGSMCLDYLGCRVHAVETATSNLPISWIGTPGMVFGDL